MLHCASVCVFPLYVINLLFLLLFACISLSTHLQLSGLYPLLLSILSIDNSALYPFEIAQLYHMRWGIETAYEMLKDRLQLENFTGTKPILLLQDIYSTIYVSNLAEDIIRDAEQEMEKKEQQRKHKMMLNRTISIGILKNDLIYIFLEKKKD